MPRKRILPPTTLRGTPRMAAPRLAATIDLGAHSARLLICEYTPDAPDISIVEELDVTIPLGADVFRRGQISNESILMLCSIFRKFRKKLDEYAVTDCRAVATSAVREASNALVLLERIRHATGIELRVFDGTDEARLNYLTVLETVPSSHGLLNKSMLIADIGTGACQISSYENGGLVFTETIRIGTLRVLETIPETTSVAGIREYVEPVIDKTFGELNYLASSLRSDFIIAMGSTVRALVQVYGGLIRKNGAVCELDRKSFETVRRTTAKMSLEELSTKFDLDKDLGEAVIPCAIILDYLFRVTGAQRLVVPMVPMKFSLMRDLIREKESIGDRFEDQIIEMVKNTARKYHCETEYAMRTSDQASALFEHLRRLHGLPERTLILLKTAAILHKSGLFINNQAYHKHTWYIINATEIPGLSKRERMLAALIGRYHRRSIPRENHPEFSVIAPDEKMLVMKLSSILRLACLFAQHGADPKKLTVRTEGPRIHFFVGISGRWLADIPRFREDLDYFEHVYAHKIVLE